MRILIVACQFVAYVVFLAAMGGVFPVLIHAAAGN